MIIKTICLSCVCFVLMAVSQVTADTNLVITGYNNGILTWTNVNPALYYSVEWRPSLTGSNDWTGSFRGLQDLQSANGTLSAPAPMFYRIIGSEAPSHTLSISPQSSSVPAGYYAATDLAVLEMDLTATNIRAGVSIFGISGNPDVVNTASGDALAGDLIAGKKAWTDGAEVVGSMPNRGAVSITPGTTPQSIPAGYHNGAGYVEGDPDLAASNIVLGVELFGITGKHGQYHENGFPIPLNTSLWDTFDAGANGLGTSLKGYMGAVFDGRYMYFVPFYNTSVGYHSKVLRLDSLGDFNSTNSWSTFDPAGNGVGNNPRGYTGGVFDGRYIYFSPYNNGSYHGEVLRLDTQENFTTTNAWTTYTPHAEGVGIHIGGYIGAVYDGRYVYFSPANDTDAASGKHGEVLRYDTQSTFNTTNAWAAFDPGSQGLGSDPDGYYGAVFDGRYVYFSPGNNGTKYHSEVLRYDTENPFGTTNSWSVFDPTANGVSTIGGGYYGAVFDGRYVYIIPLYNGSSHYGEFLRFDTTGDFSSTNAWTVYDPGSGGLGSSVGGYFGAVFDGKYIYFVPYHNGISYSGEVLRFNTQKEFTAIDSWSSYTPSSTARGFRCGGFDGRHVYFVPYYNGSGFSGEVLRFDAKNPPEVPATVSGGSFF